MRSSTFLRLMYPLNLHSQGLAYDSRSVSIHGQYGSEAECYQSYSRVPHTWQGGGKSIYVDDCLTGADNVLTAVALHKQLLYPLLRKRNTSDPDVLDAVPPDLHEC